jgi:hypothetical protein
MAHSNQTSDAAEPREVRVADPSLSPEANRILTEELRAAIGRGEVKVPRSRRHLEREPHGGRPGFGVAFSQNRLVIAMTFLIAVVIGAVLSLETGSWWLLPLALVVHALGTLAMVALVLSMTAQTEHLSPGAAARLEDEGVEDPDGLLSDLVAEFAPERAREDVHERP